jgi:[ribosomal protein S5]-alanine N-acetyltransferase
MDEKLSTPASAKEREAAEIRAVFTPFPTLTTARLALRALRPADQDDLYAYASDPEIDRYTPWRHYDTFAEAQEDLAGYIAQYERDGMGAWGIEQRAEGRLIGIINFPYWRPHHRRAEIGYTIARAHWGRGYATEAARGLIEFGFNRMNLARVEAVVMPGNAASARVLEKAGMRLEGLLRNYQVWHGRPQDLLMYAITVA